MNAASYCGLVTRPKRGKTEFRFIKIQRIRTKLLSPHPITFSFLLFFLLSSLLLTYSYWYAHMY